MVEDGTIVITPAQLKECLADLLLKFKELSNPQNNVSMERHIFFTRDQKQGESVEAYITDLKQKAKTCEFIQLHDSLIRDRFISGVNSEQLRRVLLKERDLTLARTIELPQLDEITQTCLKQFKKNRYIDYVSKTPRKPRPTTVQTTYKSQLCRNCGNKHQATDHCSAKGHQCSLCEKYNHFKNVCRSSLQQGDKTQTHVRHVAPVTQRPKYSQRSRPQQQHTPRTNSQRYRHVNEYNIYQEDDGFFVIEEVDCDLSDKEEIHTNLVLNGESVKIKIDSGAKYNVLTKTLASQISKAQKTPIKVNRLQQVKLIPCGSDSFWTLGTTTMVCSHSGETHNLLFHKVDRDVTSLLGLPDIYVTLEAATIKPGSV